MKTTPKIKKMKLLRFGRDFNPDEQVILRDYLAIERTSLYLLLGGIAFFQLKEFTNFKYLALLSLIFSGVFFVIGIYRFTLLKKSLKRVYYKSEEKQ